MPEWASILLAGAGSLVGGGVAYGMLATRVRVLEERVAELRNDKASKEGLTSLQSSVESLRRDFDKRLDEIVDLLRGRLA